MEESRADNLARSLEVLLREKDVWYIKLFNSKTPAFLVSCSLLAISVLIYVSLTFLSISCSSHCEKTEDSTTESIGISLSTRTLEFVTNDYELNRQYTQEQVQEKLKGFEDKYADRRATIIGKRESLVLTANDVLNERLGGIYLSDFSGQLKVLDTTNTREIQYEFDVIKFNEALSKLNKEIGHKLSKEKYEGSSRHEDFQMLVNLAGGQADLEQAFVKEVNSLLASSQPYMSFRWLGEMHWVLQLVFWTWHGVLVNNIVWLIRQTNGLNREGERRYSAKTYLTLFPRMLIAPIVSFIFLAMVMGGIASFALNNLENLPSFIVAAFFLGFMTESITAKLRELFNKLLESVEYKTPPKFNRSELVRAPTFKPVPNTSLAALEANMRGLTNTELGNVALSASVTEVLSSANGNKAGAR